MTNTQTRVLTAVVLIPLLLVLLVIGGIPWGIFVSVAAAIGTFEFYEMARARGHKPVAPVGIAISFGLCFALAMESPVMALGYLSIGVLVMAGLDLRRNDPSDSIANVGTSLVGIIYIGGLLSHAILVRSYVGNDALGIFYVIVALAGSMLCDTGAYFVGRAYGRNKLMPQISPGKTVQGTIGGILSGIVAICIITLIAGVFITVPFGLGMAALLGMTIGAGGVLGDLVESMFKRDAQVKDSGKIIPGHGGIFDRLDALLWSFPITYYFAVWAVK